MLVRPSCGTQICPGRLKRRLDWAGLEVLIVYSGKGRYSDDLLNQSSHPTTPAELDKMDKIPKYNVVHKLEKRSLLIAVNCLAGLSIFVSNLSCRRMDCLRQHTNHNSSLVMIRG